jgi:ribosomal protein L11 methyltransferase
MRAGSYHAQPEHVSLPFASVTKGHIQSALATARAGSACVWRFGWCCAKPRTHMPTVRLLIATTKKLAPRVSHALFTAGAQGLEERPGQGVTLVAYAEDRVTLESIWKRALQSLAGQLSAPQLPQASFQIDEEEAWKRSWTEHLQPVALTRRIVLTPTGAPAPQLTSQQELLVYEPALAFGDGGHATTRMAARAIESYYRRQPGGALLDLGSGTGVLSFVAIKSGARRALGVDVAPEALRAASENAKLNGLLQRTRFVHARARITGAFDLVVVNIELRPLLEVLGALPRVARRAPKLLLTGFLESQVETVKLAATEAGFHMRRRTSEADWVLLEGSPRGEGAARSRTKLPPKKPG